MLKTGNLFHRGYAIALLFLYWISINLGINDDITNTQYVDFIPEFVSMRKIRGGGDQRGVLSSISHLYN